MKKINIDIKIDLILFVFLFLNGDYYYKDWCMSDFLIFRVNCVYWENLKLVSGCLFCFLLSGFGLCS